MQIRLLQPDDVEQALQLRVQAFSAATHAPYDADEIYAPDEHRLVAVDRDRVIGHLAIWPVHQVFGRRLVPMGAVSAFTIAHDRRGAGIGSRLVTAALGHMRRAGLVVSTLYPSTPAPYRRWGWEFAGEHVRREVATRDLLQIPRPRTPVDLRPYAPSDLEALVEVHDAIIAREPGGLVGGRRWLARALQFGPDEPGLAVVAIRGDRPVGLLLATKTSSPTAAYGLHVHRLVGVDRDVERALLRNVGHHHPVADTTVLRSRPADPLLWELDALTHVDRGSEHVMTRVVDAASAIAARGWPPVDAVVELEVADDRMAANNRRFVLEVVDGGAALTAGGGGRTAVDIGALSALYTGFATADQLARSGRLRGPETAVATLSDVFAAPLPFIRDTY